MQIQLAFQFRLIPPLSLPWWLYPDSLAKKFTLAIGQLYYLELTYGYNQLFTAEQLKYLLTLDYTL
jgi:hypothetical protein